MIIKISYLNESSKIICLRDKAKESNISNALKFSIEVFIISHVIFDYK